MDLRKWELSPALAAALLAIATDAAHADDLSEDLKLSLWDKSIEVRGALGYKDNVLLSDVRREASGFWLSGLDFSVFRAGLDGGPTISIFGSGEDRRDFSGEVPNEDLVLTQGKISQELSPNWTIGGLAQYLYADQVFDASATEQIFETLPVKSHNVELAPLLTRALPWNSELELKFTGERQIFNQPLDSYWSYGPQLTFTKKYGNRSSVALSYRYEHRLYDTRHPLTLDRQFIDTLPLRFDLHEIELAVTHSFDKERHWRNRLRLLYGMNADNAVGFFDYRRYRAIDRFGYYAKTWQATIEGKVLYYDYLQQPVPDGSEVRQLWEYTAGAHAEKIIWKKLKIFADYEYDTVKSNFQFEKYNVNTFMGGVDWEF